MFHFPFHKDPIHSCFFVAFFFFHLIFFYWPSILQKNEEKKNLVAIKKVKKVNNEKFQQQTEMKNGQDELFRWRCFTTKLEVLSGTIYSAMFGVKRIKIALNETSLRCLKMRFPFLFIFSPLFRLPMKSFTCFLFIFGWDPFFLLFIFPWVNFFRWGLYTVHTLFYFLFLL